MLRLIVRSGLDVPNFATRRLHVSPRESTQRRKVELWARNVREFCLNADLHVTFRDLLHAVKLRRRKACRRFFRPKNPTAWAACEPANLGTKGQHATSRPPKPLWHLQWFCLMVQQPKHVAVGSRERRKEFIYEQSYFEWVKIFIGFLQTQEPLYGYH